MQVYFLTGRSPESEGGQGISTLYTPVELESRQQNARVRRVPFWGPPFCRLSAAALYLVPVTAGLHSHSAEAPASVAAPPCTHSELLTCHLSTRCRPLSTRKISDSVSDVFPVTGYSAMLLLFQGGLRRKEGR